MIAYCKVGSCRFNIELCGANLAWMANGQENLKWKKFDGWSSDGNYTREEESLS